MILEQFDSNKKSIINPEDIVEKIENIPEIAIACFSKRLFDKLVIEFNAEPIITKHFGNANSKDNLYKFTHKDKEFALFMTFVGAPNTVGQLEELHYIGIKKFVIFGTCGVLDSSIKELSIIIPNKAVRDEGTSYHYKEASDEIDVNNDKNINDFIDILNKNNITYTVGKVWTNDAFYRETHKKMQDRKNSGCICVDMECSAVAAFADFRDVEIFHFFYSADNLDSENWDKRSLGCETDLDKKTKIGFIAAEMAYKMRV